MPNKTTDNEIREEWEKKYGYYLKQQKAKLYNDGKYSSGFKKDFENAERETNEIADWWLNKLSQILTEKDKEQDIKCYEHSKQEVKDERERIVKILHTINEEGTYHIHDSIISLIQNGNE